MMIMSAPTASDTAAVFAAVPGRSALLIRVRSNVGPIEFGATGLNGTLQACVSNSHVVVTETLGAHLELSVEELTSGNALYDAEFLRKIDARRFPVAVVELEEAEALEPLDLFHVQGPVTFHGVTRSLGGVIQIVTASDDRIIVRGERSFDIRDFNITPPTMLMLKIYPDVQVHLLVEAERVV
jgi:hypothetical protein